MKKKIFTIVAAVLCLCALCAVAVSAENAPETDIVAHNLSLNDSVNIVYYADFQNVPENAEKGILIWTSAQDEYIYGSENAKLTTIRGISLGYPTYAFTGVSAKMMSQDIYAKSYIKVGDEITYGPLDKYSVLQYAYNKKGSTSVIVNNGTTLGELLVGLLDYGTLAQTYFGYNLDRLANATYYKIDVVNGALPDGMTSGLYPAGTELTITAKVHDGENFDCWQNSNGDSVGSDETLTITVTSDETYTAVYVPVLKPSEGLEFTSNEDGTCYVSDIGDCEDVDIVIPSTSPEGDTVTNIGNSAFKNNTSIKSITIPSSVISIEANAFRGCSALEEIIFIGNETEWNAISKGNNWNNGTGDYTLTFTQQTEEHTFGEWIPEVPATCANDGVKGHYVCSTCGKYFDADQNEIDDLTIAATADHTYGEWIEEFPATCTENGTKGHYTCSTCQKYFDAEYNEISDLAISAGHKEVIDSAVTPTCTNPGVTEGKHCSVCGEILIAQTVIPATGHNYENGICTVCGQKKPSEGLEFTSNEDGTCYVSDIGDCEDTDIVIPSTSPEGDTVTSIGNSAFKNNTSIKSITIPSSVISIEANAFRGCSALEEIIFIGNETEWNAISKGNNWDYGTGDYTLTFTQQTEEHTFGEWIPEVPATCANDGVKGHYVCSTCGKYFDADQNEIDDLTIAATADHTYGDWNEEVPATCANDGVKGYYTCSTCQKYFDAEYNEISDLKIPALGHTEVIDTAVAPTCEGTGLTEGTHCSVCQTVLVAQTVVDALGHNWDDGVVTKTPTDTEPGVITYTCSRCKTTKTEDIPIKIASKGLAFTSNNDGTCYVSGIGTCTDLDIVIPTKSPADDTVTAIGANAFSGCSTLTSIEIPNSVISIGDNALYGCSNLKSITIPFVGTRAGVTANNTHQYPFGRIFGDANEQTNNYPGGTETKQYYHGPTYSIVDKIYYIPASLKSVTVTGGYIPYGAFYNCSGLTSITIGNGVTEIAEKAFFGCSSLTSIEIPESVTSIGEGAFNACSNLESITIPFVGNRAGVTASDTYQYPFGYIFGTEYYTGGTAKTQYYYGSSTAVTINSNYFIPKSLKSVTVTGGYIPYGAFLGCSKVLSNITIGKGVTGIGSQAFYNCDTLERVNITDLTKWCEISFSDHDANPLSWGANKLYLNGELVTELVIPEGITSIGAWAFYGCTSLTSVNIPASVTSIGWEAFRECDKLESITFVENSQLTSIANGAFYGCKILTSIDLPANVTSIGEDAFKECRAFTTIDLPSSVTSIGEGAFRSCSALTSIKIPENITSIGNSTFNYCTELTSVDIPVSVTSIGDTVFYNCGHLTSINYNGTKAQWNEISKGSNWNSGTGDYTIYCTDENITK